MTKIQNKKKLKCREHSYVLLQLPKRAFQYNTPKKKTSNSEQIYEHTNFDIL